MDLPPVIRPVERERACRARCAFDAESSLVSVEFETEARDSSSLGVQRAVDWNVGIRVVESRLNLGGVDIILAPPGQLLSIDYRVCRPQCSAHDVQVPTDAASIWFVPEVSFDENNISVVELDPRCYWNEARRSLILSFSREPPSRWFSLADGAYMAMDSRERMQCLLLTCC